MRRRSQKINKKSSKQRGLVKKIKLRKQRDLVRKRI